MIASLLAAAFTIAVPDPDAVIISAAAKDAAGFLVHTVTSPYQSGRTHIRVLIPGKAEKGTRLPVVYLLPVEAGTESRYGDGLAEVRKHDLHNKLNAVFVAPTFSHLPWYADHPTKPDVRQETYFLQVVVPFVEKTYPVKGEAEGRLLLGFSKSGWGAFSLLLRHPDTFGKAAAWDAPMMMDAPGKYGSGDIFGTAENFAGYRVSKLLEEKGRGLGREPRLVLLGYGNFRGEHQKAHELMDRLKVPHEYRDGPARKHDWHSGWVAEAAALLLPERPPIREETPEEAKRRHERVAERRKGTDVICHRGASEHAHENTLEAFRATFELGGDGNEFDIRRTRDGVLVVFHDDMLDRLLDGYGDAVDVTWDELRRMRFRNPGRFGDQCRIPTLAEVFDLHRRYAGLMHLDIKRPGLDAEISDLLTKMDLWDHVGYCNTETGGVILRDPRYVARRYKGGLYADHSEVFPEQIAAMLKKPGDGVIVDDPRGVAVALGRKLGKLSAEPVSRVAVTPPAAGSGLSESQLVAALRRADDRDRVADTPFAMAASGALIRRRARAADELLALKASSKEAFAALEDRARDRSLHRDWMYHGFDGAIALRTLLLLRAPSAVETARFVLWRDDPALEPVIDPRWKNPRSWTDFRVKMVVFPALAACPGPAAENLCRDYLALPDEDAAKLGPEQFEQAGRALLAISPKTETALELMKHRLRAVRGRTILDCLAHAQEPWALAALEKGAPHALAYRTPE